MDFISRHIPRKPRPSVIYDPKVCSEMWNKHLNEESPPQWKELTGVKKGDNRNNLRAVTDKRSEVPQKPKKCGHKMAIESFSEWLVDRSIKTAKAVLDESHTGFKKLKSKERAHKKKLLIRKEEKAKAKAKGKAKVKGKKANPFQAKKK